MDTVIYEGKEYHRDQKGVWRNSDNVKVYEGLQTLLNKNWAEKLNVDIETLAFEELITFGDKFKQSGDYARAILCYERALTFDREEIRWMLATLSACYRGIKTPKKSIALYERYNKNPYITSQFLTSVAAACLDDGNCPMATALANRAYAFSDGRADEELKNVFRRIKKECKGDK